MSIPPRPAPGATLEERAAFWRACMEAVGRGEFTVQGLCRAAGVSKCLFYAWRRRLHPAMPAATPVHAASKRSGVRATLAPGFVEIRPARPALAPNAPPSDPSAAAGLAWLAELVRLSAQLHHHLRTPSDGAIHGGGHR